MLFFSFFLARTFIVVIKICVYGYNLLFNIGYFSNLWILILILYMENVYCNSLCLKWYLSVYFQYLLERVSQSYILLI